VSDIIGQGKDREPRWPRWPKWQRAALVADVVVALAAVLAWYLPRLHQPGARPGPSAAGTSPVTPGRPASPIAQPSPPPTKPAQMTGRQLPRDAGLRVPTGGFQPAWLSVATGRIDPVRGLPANGNSYQLFRVAGGWAVQPFPPANTGCTGCAPRPLPVYYLADGSPAVRRLGAADFTAPAASAGALWLISYRPGADMGTAAATAQQVSVTGQALGRRLTLPAGYVIDQATRAGLLLVPELAGPGPVRYQLWDAGRPASPPARYRPAHRCSVRSPTPLCPAIRASGTPSSKCGASSRQRVIACSRSGTAGRARPRRAGADPGALEQMPRGRHRTTLQSPFDSLIWDRKRTQRMFGFSHSLEAYVPAHQPVHGYFAMPLLAGGRLAGRVDPARSRRTLIARRVSLERASAAEAMVQALREAASWVGCDEVRLGSSSPGSTRDGCVRRSRPADPARAGTVRESRMREGRATPGRAGSAEFDELVAQGDHHGLHPGVNLQFLQDVAYVILYGVL
jgi:hypothetical protein